MTIQSAAAHKMDLPVRQTSGCDSPGFGKKRKVRKGMSRNPGLLLPHSSPLRLSTCCWKGIASVFENSSVARWHDIKEGGFLPVLPSYFPIPVFRLLYMSACLPHLRAAHQLTSIALFLCQEFCLFSDCCAQIPLGNQRHRWTFSLLLCCHCGNI